MPSGEQILQREIQEAAVDEWRPFPGAQTKALGSVARETLFGGARGPGKTHIQLMWMAKLAVAQDSMGRPMYPSYRGLLLRYYATDLKDVVDRATMLYCGRLGATRSGNPPEFRFPGGPVIRTGHLQDGAFTKYVGWNVHKLGVDEVTHLPRQDDYVLFINGSLRLSPDGTAQAFLTGNPGFIGDLWVKRRFVNVTVGGQKIPPGTMFKDPVSGNTRVYYPATVFDNPWLLQNDPAFLKGLMELPEAKRRAWIYGDWDALTGQFFEEFRPDGPLDGEEPAWARHMVSEEQAAQHLPGFCHRWIAMDWGYSHPSCVLWFANGLDGRVHVYRERNYERTSSFEIGVDIAKATFGELEGLPENQVTMYLSPDAWDVRDAGPQGGRRVEGIMQGIQAVLGGGTSFILEMTPDEKRLSQTDPDLALRSFQSRRAQSQSRYCITIARANNDRVDGWNYCRELLRWRKFEIRGEPDAEVVERLRSKANAEELVRQYLSAFDRREEVLPKILIHEGCKRLRETIPLMVHNDAKPEDLEKVDGDDPVDAWRYGCMAHRDMQNNMPVQAFIHDRVNRVSQNVYGTPMHMIPEGRDRTALHIAHLKAEAEYRKKFGSDGIGASLPRYAAPRIFSRRLN